MFKARLATELDSTDVFRWRNDESTIAASISNAPVEWEDHQAWFAAALASDKRWIFIVFRTESESQKVGMCRFDVASGGTSAEVSINLNPDYRGQRLARAVLTTAIEAFRRATSPTVRLTATIRRANLASEKVFRYAGFTTTSSDHEFARYSDGSG
ncbi:MAG TPA: GNAT family N-acetyltransferase [Terrimesophilobacter sp.]|nr:GNAT family N-acetyltransferase [Terrimesophilobacter sp.]